MLMYRICRCFELAHVVCIGHSIHVMTISDFGYPERLARVPESFVFAILSSALIAASGASLPCIYLAHLTPDATVQLFFAYRMYRLSGNLFVTCLSWTSSLARFVCSIVVFVYGLHMTTLENLEDQTRRLLVTVWSISAANDVFIAINLVYWFHRRRGSAETA
jgi:hypothetical protein